MANTRGSANTSSLLLIEDNPGDARLVREMLRDLGEGRYSLVVESRLESAVERLGCERYDAILLDLLLPGFMGLEALIALRPVTRGTPIVVVSGVEDESLAVASLRAGAQDYLVKGRFEEVLFDRAVRFAIERHHAEEMLERSASILQATLDATVDGIVVVDRDRRIVSSNRRFHEMWELAVELAPGRDESPLLDRLAGEMREPARFTTRVEEIYAGTDEETYDLLDLVNGRVYERTSSPYVLDGHTVGRMWSFHDATERKRAVDALRASARAERAGNRAHTDFLAFLSHELREPLHAIQGFGDRFAERELDGDTRDRVDRLGTAAGHMRALLESIRERLPYPSELGTSAIAGSRAHVASANGDGKQTAREPSFGATPYVLPRARFSL